jgi:hypothetical protein
LRRDLARAGDLLLDSARVGLRRHALDAVAATPGVASELGHRASLLGSVLLAAESTELLSDSTPRRRPGSHPREQTGVTQRCCRPAAQVRRQQRRKQIPLNNDEQPRLSQRSWRVVTSATGAVHVRVPHREIVR